ncbi:acetyltransferase (GNAT) family [Vibrio ishigakensis]|uniref:Acetyltransferase (GNAT) family n=1 Tax=Vibrio ishigakensis TaxID=1481914 RepID=A0A0B8PHC3_9VIBR|nr:acetyltransferase (GNAT) family [Vibrio ishigakensis]
MLHQPVFELSHNHTLELLALYRKQWWSTSRTLEQTEACVENSALCVGIVNEEQQLIGFARVLSDKVFKALIFDVIVDSDYQGQGISTLILDCIKTHPSLAKVQHFELYCLPDMFDFYRKQGFSNEVSGVQLMRLANPILDNR